MEICYGTGEISHDEIVYEGYDCPLCRALKKMGEHHFKAPFTIHDAATQDRWDRMVKMFPFLTEEKIKELECEI